jgi:hypothetical protein
MRDKLHALDIGIKGGTLCVKFTHLEVRAIFFAVELLQRNFMFKRRLGQNGRQTCSTGAQCPQILEMNDGDFAAVGPNITEEAMGSLPPGPGVGPKEGVVKVPRAVMLAAMSEILATA